MKHQKQKILSSLIKDLLSSQFSPIVIRVVNSDSYFAPCDSKIEFEGHIVKDTDGAMLKKADVKFALINNGLMYLFDNIKYKLSSVEIDSV